jgi:hypothetical protein
MPNWNCFLGPSFATLGPCKETIPWFKTPSVNWSAGVITLQPRFVPVVATCSSSLVFYFVLYGITRSRHGGYNITSSPLLRVPASSQPTKIELDCKDLLEAFRDDSESIKYLSEKPCL